MGKDKKKRLEELIDEVDKPERVEPGTTESGEAPPSSMRTGRTEETDSVGPETERSDREIDLDVRFPDKPVIETKEEYLLSLLISLGAGFVTFVALIYLLVIIVDGYERINFFNSLLFSIVAFLYVFKHIGYND